MAPHARLIADPLVLLAPGRCFSSVVSAMLGQHPEMYGILENQLFVRERMSEWWEDFGHNIHSHGLSRSVAEIVFGEQSAPTIRRARRWLWKRRDRTTAEVFSELSTQVYPLRLIDKTPMVTYRREHMERVRLAFPRAKFLHLVRHPIGYGRSLLQFFEKRAPMRHPVQTESLFHNCESIFYGLLDEAADPPLLDPQNAWHLRQSSVVAFTSTLPPHQHLRIRGEDILSDPIPILRRICEWMELRRDEVAFRQMLHPERSAFACVGPWNARFGGDPGFLRNPIFRALHDENHRLEQPLPWRRDGLGLQPRVIELARQFGYQ
jgi:hypothetical protein